MNFSRVSPQPTGTLLCHKTRQQIYTQFGTHMPENDVESALEQEALEAEEKI